MDVKLGNIDKKLLYELSTNSRISKKELSSRFRISIQTVSRKIDYLIKQGILVNTHPIIDHSRLGFIGYRIYFNFFGTTPREEVEILEWLKNHRFVSVLAQAIGSVDVVVMSWVREKESFFSLVKELKERFRDRISNIETFSYVRTHHFSRDYLVDDRNILRKRIVTGDAKERIKIDDVDVKILECIKENARKTTKEISFEIGEPVTTVAYRLKRMEREKLIVGYGANIDIGKLGFEYYKLNIIFNKPVEYEKLLSFSYEIRNSVYVDETIGKYDFELNVEVRNREEVDNIINNLKELVGGFRRLDIFQVKGYNKLSYFSA